MLDILHLDLLSPTHTESDYRKNYKIYFLEVIYVYPQVLTNWNIQQVQTIQTGATVSTEPEMSLLP